MRKAISLVSFGVLCATLILLMQYDSPQLAAAEHTPQPSSFPLLLERGQNYSHTLVGATEDHQMIINTTLNLPNWIMGSNGYVPYLLTENSTTYKIETNDGSMIFHKTGCNVMFYNPGKINSTIDKSLLSSESWITHQRNLTDMSAWEYIAEVNDATCTNTLYENSTDGSIVLESNKTSTDIATFSTKYIKNQGIQWKVLTQVTNENPMWTNNSMGFIETLHVPDTIYLNGTSYHIPSNNNTFFDHDFFMNTIHEIRLGDIPHYLTDDGLVNLWGATLIDDNGTSKITFDYSFNDNATALGETYEIDPTVVIGVGSAFRGNMLGEVSSVCGTLGGADGLGFFIRNSASVIAQTSSQGATPSCTYASVEFDITAIPEAATITDSDITMDATQNGGRVCSWREMTTQPSTFPDTAQGAQDLRDDALDGSVYISGSGTCRTGGSNDLGATADADIQSSLGVNWFGMGITYDNYARGVLASATPTGITLTVQYTTPTFIIDIPTSFGATAVEGAAGSGAICLTPRGSILQGGVHQVAVIAGATTTGFSCQRPLFEFPTTALSNMTIIDVDMEYRVITIGNPRVCDFVGANTLQPSISLPNTANATIIWDDISDGPNYLTSESTCTDTTPNPETIDLSPLADADLQTAIDTSKGWFAVGQKMTDESRDGLTHLSRGEINTAVLVVEFSLGSPPPVPPPDKPLNVDATNNRDGKIRLTWDANNAANVTNYDVFSSDDYNGPFTLLETIGNVTTYAHTGLADNTDKYYKIRATFNPDGFNSTVVFGTSGNPFVNDTSAIETQYLWMGDNGGYDIIHMRQEGTGANCPSITGPSSVGDFGSTTIKLYDQSDPLGCEFLAYTMDRTTTPQFLIPQFFEDYLSRIMYYLEFGSTTLNVSCEYKSLSNAGGGQIDPRINLTRAYELAIEGSLERDLTAAYLSCQNNQQQSPSIFRGDGGNEGVDLYRDSMAFNSSFFSFASGVNTELRNISVDRNVQLAGFLQRFEYVNPTFSKIWNIQEHPKFDDESLTEANAKETFDGKFNLNTFADNTDRGQIVIFKEFNTTQAASTTPNIRVTGTYQTNSVTDDVNLRFEIKDGGYGMGRAVQEFPDFFPVNEFDVYQDGGSLGVIHSSPIGTGVESFDITITPNWSNSTSDIYTVFIGLDDNSTTSNLSANITNFYIEDTLTQDFEDLGYVQYYEVSTVSQCETSSTGCIMGRSYYNSGLVLSEQVGSISISDLTLPIPPTPTSANAFNVSGSAIDVFWNQSLLNTTDFQISRELGIGGGFTKIAETNNVTLAYEDTGLAPSTEYNYEICAINGESIETTCVTASATTNASPAVSPPDIDNVIAVANLEDIIVTWFDSGINITDYQIERNGTLIVPSVSNTTSDFLVDDFSSYPDIATANATWVGTIGTTDPLDDLAFVNVTDDRIYFRSSPGGETQINLDLESLLGQNLTDASGVGDFNMTWTQQELNHDTALNEVGGMYIKFSDRIASGTGLQTGIRIDFNYREMGFPQQAAIRTAEDDLGFNSFIVIDVNCGDGALGFIDVAPNDSIADTPVTLYGQFTKVGQQLTYMMGTNPDWTGLGCSATATATDTMDDMKYLALTRAASGSGSTDALITFDDFTISVNGTLVKFYRDENVTLGTNLIYNVSAINHPMGTTPTIGNATESNVVKSNDIPSATLNVEAQTVVGKIIVNWDEPTSDGSGNPLGVGVPLLQYQIFSKNVTDGDDFILTQELLSPTTFDDFAVELPKDYNYTISACNFLGCGPNSTEVEAFLIPLDAPVNLTATIDRLIEIFLNWDGANATSVTGYNIYNSSTGVAPFELLNTIGNTTEYTDTGLPNNFDMFYKVSALSPVNTGFNSTVAFGSTIQPGQPVNIDNVNATAVLPFDVLVEWADSGVNITDYQIERNGTLIVPSLLDALVQFLRDDFSTYPDNVTANLTWIPTLQGTGSADDIVGVNTTDDRIYFTTNTATGSQIAFDLEELLGANLTDSSGVGDFNMTWTHKLEFIGSPFDANTDEMRIALTDRDVLPNNIQTGIKVGFIQRDPGFINLAGISVADDDLGFLAFENLDTTCGDGSLTWNDDTVPGINELNPIVYSTLSKTGSLIQYKVGLDDGFGGLSCFASTITVKTPDDIKFLKITRIGTGSSTFQQGWIFDDFAISTNGTLVKLYRDMDTALGTHYTYDVSGINAPNGSLSIVGNPTTSNLVKTNDVPTQIQNVIADLVNFFTLNQIELDWTQANDGSGNPLGEGVSLNETRIYSKNITDGGNFILTVTLPAASPPPTEYNDTNIIIPNDYSYMLSSCNVLGCGPNSTEVFADSIDFPDAIFDLIFYDLDFKSLILNWTQPFLGGGTLQDGYQINFTTPHAEPLTIIVDDTESTFTEFTVSGLTEQTNYTFRVSAINQAGLNATGLKLNITTPEDFTSENFTVGFIGEFPDVAIDAENEDIIPIRFERIDINDTTVRLNVTYANNIDLACQFEYKFAMTETFFDAPLDVVSVGGGDQETSFLFNDFDNEVIDVFCWNEVNNQSGSYILTQTNFPLLQQIQAFRDGDFGTEGMFGVLDMITLMVIIISMIGFNRVNETVGAIFNIIFIGALSFFGIIELSTTIFAAVALVLMLVIISTRKV